MKILEPCLYQKPRGNNDGGLIENISPTMTSNSWQENVLLCEPSGVYTECSPEFQRKPLPGVSRTLKAEKHDSGVFESGRIRKLTPIECFRLMGFSDEDFYKAKYYECGEAKALLEKYPKHFNKKQHRQFTQEQRIERISNSQLYKQAGNSIVVNVLERILWQLF